MGDPHPDGLVIIRDVRGLRGGWPSSRWSCYYLRDVRGLRDG